MYQPSWPKSDACSITLFIHDEYTLPLVRKEGHLVVGEKGKQLAELVHLQRVIAASSQPPPAESMSPR